MQVAREHAELMMFLKSDFGKDLLSALPLVASHFESTALLSVLRSSAAEIIPAVEAEIGREVCLLAFGSLGRLEYVAGASDLDPIILVDGTCSPTMAAAVRAAILPALSKMNPWLGMDWKDEILRNDWAAIPNPDIPYPVLGTAELRSADSLLAMQRRWQMLLEGRPLYNDSMFYSVYESLLPQIKRSKPLLEPHMSGPVAIIDFRVLADAGVSYFGGFDSPAFLFKSPFKYFKTRFLRDFFVFGTQLLFVLGWYLQEYDEQTQLPPRYIRAATVTKIMRVVRFAVELERECKGNSAVASMYEADIKETITRFELHVQPMMLFGAHYSPGPGRLLHGLVMSVLSRFVACWDRIYDPYVRSVLERVPKHLNFESRFPQTTGDPVADSVLAELQERRDSYRRYMAATATVIRDKYPLGRVWAHATVPSWVSDALEPFTKP